MIPTVTLPAGVAVGQCSFRNTSDFFNVVICNICVVLYVIWIIFSSNFFLRRHLPLV